MKKEILVNIMIIAVIIGGAVFFLTRNQTRKPEISTSAPNVKNEGKTPQEENFYSLAEVAKHNKENDCWVVIENKVYRVENYINDHPGGSDKIINNCGKDATNFFNSIKNGQGHSQKAWQKLEEFYIGSLKKEK